MKEIVLATGNAHKVKEIDAILKTLGITVVPQSKYRVSEVPETGTTFVENAIIKARPTKKGILIYNFPHLSSSNSSKSVYFLR